MAYPKNIKQKCLRRWVPDPTTRATRVDQNKGLEFPHSVRFWVSILFNTSNIDEIISVRPPVIIVPSHITLIAHHPLSYPSLSYPSSPNLCINFTRPNAPSPIFYSDLVTMGRWGDNGRWSHCLIVGLFKIVENTAPSLPSLKSPTISPASLQHHTGQINYIRCLHLANKNLSKTNSVLQTCS